MAKECTLSTDTCKLPLGALPRNSVVRITDCPDMNKAVYSGCKSRNKKILLVLGPVLLVPNQTPMGHNAYLKNSYG